MYQPTEIKKIDAATLGITWSDGHESFYPLSFLRGECRCALCIDEWTGEKKISSEQSSREGEAPRTLFVEGATRAPVIATLQLPKHVAPLKIESVGHYGLQIFWDDGHSQGIYTYQHLRALCACKECQKLKS